MVRGVPRIWQGGGKNFFSDLKICLSRIDMLRMAKPCALLGGFGGMPLRDIFLKWCNLVRFGVYFLYKRINILDTRLLWGNNYSREEIFEKFMIDAFW